MVGQKDTGNDFKWEEMTLCVALTTGTETIVNVGSGSTPIKTYEGQGILGSTGGTATATRISDA